MRAPKEANMDAIASGNDSECFILLATDFGKSPTTLHGLSIQLVEVSS